MKLVLFENPGDAGPRPGLLTERGIVDISGHVAQGYTPQLTMQGIIDEFERLRPVLEKLAADGAVKPPASVRLRPPLPRPGKILCCIGNYWEHAQREPRPLNMFMKNPEAVVGPGDTIMLPKLTEPWIFMHEAELALVIKGPAKEVKREDWRSAIFGYTGLIDVSARGEGRRTWKAGSWLGKSFDTFAPIGPCITTADEIPEPNDLVVRFWNDGQLRHNYNTDDMEHRVPELVEFASMIMTLNTGDQFPGSHVELGEMQWALDQAANQLAARQRCVSVSTGIPQRIKGAVDIRQHDTLAIDRDEFHFARRQVTGLADGHKPFRNCA